MPKMLLFTVASLFITSLLPLLSSALDKDANTTLVDELRLANTNVDRWGMLSDSDYVYNFSSNPLHSFSPGSVCNANVATFPILEMADMTVSQLNLGPCAILPPHIHRAWNLVVAVAGTTHTYMYPEDGGNLIQTELSPGLMTVFPHASLHSMVNEGCTNNQLYSFLNSKDAGRLTVANAIWQFGYDIFTDVFPFFNTTSSSNYNSTVAQIPPIGTGSIAGYQACLKRCGLTDADARSGVRGRVVKA